MRRGRRSVQRCDHGRTTRFLVDVGEVQVLSRPAGRDGKHGRHLSAASVVRRKDSTGCNQSGVRVRARTSSFTHEPLQATSALTRTSGLKYEHRVRQHHQYFGSGRGRSQRWTLRIARPHCLNSRSCRKEACLGARLVFDHSSSMSHSVSYTHLTLPTKA